MFLGAPGIHGIVNDALKFSWLTDCRCCNNSVIIGETWLHWADDGKGTSIKIGFSETPKPYNGF
jgi:hypothetical protein